MKRQNYFIFVNGEHVATKHAWNSACAEMRTLVGQAIPDGCAYNSVSENFRKLEKSNRGHFKGDWKFSNPEISISASVILQDC